MNPNPYNVRVGQIWGDCDPRMGGREIQVTEVTDTHAHLVIVRPNADNWTDTTGRKIRIRLDRFKPTRTGYRLVKETQR